MTDAIHRKHRNVGAAHQARQQGRAVLDAAVVIKKVALGAFDQAYELTGAGLRLANFYFFFDARKEMDEIVAKVACSAHHDLRTLPLRDILRPELTDCRVIVVANKKVNDGIYFSRIGIDPLIGFLERERFPADLVSFARAHRHELDHMLYDVGLDYVVEAGAVKIIKSAFYGLL
jgi:hypothetical protein